jgi:hypothetical protein
MRDATEELILILDLRASRKKTKFVRERVELGLCLGECEDGKQCERKAAKRGLCERCYATWWGICKSKSDKDAALYTARLIRVGRILSRGDAAHYRRKSIFRRLA